MRLVFSAARCQLRDENGAPRGGELLWVVSESRDVPLCPEGNFSSMSQWPIGAGKCSSSAQRHLLPWQKWPSAAFS